MDLVRFVETHGRKHTAELVEGLEVQPQEDVPLPRQERLAHRRKRRGSEGTGRAPRNASGER
jgi:hypothetical protein